MIMETMHWHYITHKSRDQWIQLSTTRSESTKGLILQQPLNDQYSCTTTISVEAEVGHMRRLK